MFKSLRKIKEYTKLGHSMNVVSEMLSKTIEKHRQGNDPTDLKEEIYIISYVARKGILDRMEEYEWSMEGSILVPAINSKNITLFYAYSNTILRIKSLSIELDLTHQVESILNKEEGYYEFERVLPVQNLNQLNKFILIS